MVHKLIIHILYYVLTDDILVYYLIMYHIIYISLYILSFMFTYSLI